MGSTKYRGDTPETPKRRKVGARRSLVSCMLSYTLELSQWAQGNEQESLKSPLVGSHATLVIYSSGRSENVW